MNKISQPSPTNPPAATTKRVAGSAEVGFNVVLVGYLQSVGQALKATAFTLLRGFIPVIPGFLLLPLRIGIPGIRPAVPVAEVLTPGLMLLTRTKNN